MKAYEIMDELFSLARPFDASHTCDTCKGGDPNVEVTRIAVSMFATPDVIRQAANFSAQLLIVHEPTYYNHMDYPQNEALEREKRQFVRDSGLTIYRFHDFCHAADPDLIDAGQLRYLDLPCTVERPQGFGPTRLKLNTPMTPRQLAKHIEDTLRIAHVKIAGAADTPCTHVTCMFGTPGGVLDELMRDGCEIILTGEICEWCEGQYVRDMAQLGHTRALLVLGHIGSERYGMRHVSDLLQSRHPELEVRYIECGEVYTYTDR